MQHIDEHTLELFVLDPGELGGREVEIRSHLAECQGCRLLAERMRSLYQQAERELANQPAMTTKRSGVVARRRVETTSLYEPIRAPVSRNVRTELQGVRRFVVRHPVITATSTFALFASVVAGITMAVNSSRMDSNPAYIHLNPEQELLEAFNSRNERLWNIPGFGFSDVQKVERDNHISYTQVVDLDGDGVNEVVTGVPLNLGGNTKESLVRILDSRGRVVKEMEVGEPIDFGRTHYASDFSPRQILVIRSSAGGKKEIIVGSSSVRSPYVISRLSSTGETLGEYWHFGVLYGLYSLDVDGDGREEIVASGTNDVIDTTGDTGSSPAVIVVLKPGLIEGKTESGQTRGFGLQPSGAEIRYIYLPRSDLHESLGASAGAKSMVHQQDSTLVFNMRSGTPDQHPVFYFTFSRNLTPLAVASDDETERLHFSMKKDGRVTSRWGEGYMRELLGRIRTVEVPSLRTHAGR